MIAQGDRVVAQSCRHVIMAKLDRADTLICAGCFTIGVSLKIHVVSTLNIMPMGVLAISAAIQRLVLPFSVMTAFGRLRL